MARKKAAETSPTNVIPSVLSYERSLDFSSARMDAVLADGSVVPIEVTLDTVRGCVSDYKSVSGKNSKNVDAPNIQRVDRAIMPEGSTALRISFSVKVFGKSLQPLLCNNRDFEENLSKLALTYCERGGMEYLAALYLEQIFNGSWAWRNEEGSGTVTVTSASGNVSVQHKIEDTGIEVNDGFLKLVKLFGKALSGDRVARFQVVADLPRFAREEVWPSQEFIENDKAEKGKDGAISKVLYRLKTPESQSHAGMHSQKIGNAVRTIDEWWDADAFPIAVEPTGYYQRQYRTLRVERGITLYDYLKDVPTLLTELEKTAKASPIPGHIHFLVACLIRGGVFGGESDKKKDKEASTEAEEG